MANAIGEEIRKLRKEKGLKLREIERETDISQGYLSQIELGDRNVSPEKLSILSKVLGVSKLHLYKFAGYLDETDILELVDENKRLREALGFYANENNYFVIDMHERSRVHEEGGQIAREALEGDSK